MSLIPGLSGGAQVLIAGASRGIGLALCAALLARDDVTQVWAVARQAGASAELAKLAERYGQRLKRVDCDARDEISLETLVSKILEECDHLHLAISTLGILHQDGAKAEKALSQLTLASLQATFATNTFAPILLLKHLLPLLRKQPATFAALSARVGSIGDNRLGGWYSYRAAKAALNMLLKTAAIELARSHPQAVLAALHPGTVDSALSAPFRGAQIGRPAADAARDLLKVLDGLIPEDSGGLWAYDGQRLPW